MFHTTGVLAWACSTFTAEAAAGSKEQYVLWYLADLQLGIRVVAVEYRLSGAPFGACRGGDSAARSVAGAERRQVWGGSGRLVITGGSAGGHLALMTAMLTARTMRPAVMLGRRRRARSILRRHRSGTAAAGRKPHRVEVVELFGDPPEWRGGFP